MDLAPSVLDNLCPKCWCVLPRPQPPYTTEPVPTVCWGCRETCLAVWIVYPEPRPQGGDRNVLNTTNPNLQIS